MSMLRKLFALGLLAAALFFVARAILDNSGLEKVSLQLPDSIRLDVSRSYVMPSEGALTYVLSQSPERIWISSAAILSGTNNQTARYPYHLLVSVYDNQDQVLFEKQFHHHALATTKVELKENGQIVPEAFLSDGNSKLSATENLHIRLPAGATKLIISQVVKSPQINDVAVRAYQHVQRSSRVEPIDLWERLSLKQRGKLLEYYPFEEPFLTDSEKSNLAEYRWQPLVPSGDENKDYMSLLMYRIPQTAIAQRKYLLSQYSHQADVYKRVSFPIEVAGTYRLEGSHNFTERDYQVFMSWFNPNDSLEKADTFDFNSQQFSQEFELKPGLVTFMSSIPVSLQLFGVSGFVEEHDHFSPQLILTPEAPITYELVTADSGSTPYQIRSRAFAEQALATQEGAELTISLYTQDKVVQQHRLSTVFYPEENKQLTGEEYFNWLGSESRLFLELRAGIDKMVLTSNQPLLTSVFTRVNEMPAVRFLPEEKRDWYDFPTGVPDWFSVRPENWEEQINEGNIRVLKNYHRSLLAEQPQDDPDETYQSLLSDFSQFTLADLIVQNPYPGQRTRLEENTSLNFAKLDEFPVFETPSQSSRPIAKKLFFLKSDSVPLQVAWSKNGETQAPFWVAGNWGIVDASVIGNELEGEISMNTPGVRWWRNGLPRESTEWQQRRGLLLRSGETVTLATDKKAEQEVLSIVVYSTSQEPVALDIKFPTTSRNESMQDVYTILHRRFNLQPKVHYSGYQLSGRRNIVARQSFSILLDKDISNSIHDMQITHMQGKDVYISVVKRVIKPTPIIERYRLEREH
ncbi:MAG: hypothetical protein GJ680_08385 [Alteromonadaceae bacterium]|nr:hypothetical protein [Alteromonadaceae bacterium]